MTPSAASGALERAGGLERERRRCHHEHEHQAGRARALVGGVVGVLVWLAVDDARLEDTLLKSDALVSARDQLTKVSDSVEGALDKAGDKLD